MPLTGFRKIAEVNLPTRWANFRLLAFEALRIIEFRSKSRSKPLWPWCLAIFTRRLPRWFVSILSAQPEMLSNRFVATVTISCIWPCTRSRKPARVSWSMSTRRAEALD